MNIRTLLSLWQYDPISSLLTVIVIPILIYIAAIVKRPLFAGIKYITLGVLYAVSASLSKAAAASLSLRRYVSIQLSGSNRHLYVPALKDVHLGVDTIFVPLTLVSES
jgi:hypothetical protein